MQEKSQSKSKIVYLDKVNKSKHNRIVVFVILVLTIINYNILILHEIHSLTHTRIRKYVSVSWLVISQSIATFLSVNSNRALQVTVIELSVLCIRHSCRE